MSSLGLELVLYGALPTSASFVTMISWCFPFLPSPRLATKKCSTNVAMFIVFCDFDPVWSTSTSEEVGAYTISYNRSLCNKEPSRGTKFYFSWTENISTLWSPRPMRVRNSCWFRALVSLTSLLELLWIRVVHAHWSRSRSSGGPVSPGDHNCDSSVALAL